MILLKISVDFVVTKGYYFSMKIEYSSNNSGGKWWLSDEDWYALEKAGWEVAWVKDNKSGLYGGKDRFLGGLAMEASKEFETPADAMIEFEEITGQTVSDEGCNCCGAPHTFKWTNKDETHYASGEDCLEYLFPDQGKLSLREAYKKLEEE